MKFNWGTGIFLFYTVFAGSLFYQVYASTKYSNDLVEENYYEKDIAYQSRYDRIENSMELENPMQINYSEEKQMIDMVFPAGEKAPTGNIRLFRSDDKKKDLRLPLNVLDNTMSLNTEELSTGVWKVEIEWDMDEIPYFDSKSIFIK